MSARTLITGASSGIGAELTELFAADGDDLVLVARREQRLQDLAARMEGRHRVNATVISMDLVEPDADERLFEAVQERGIEVTTLVNNAGFGNYGRFDGTDIETETTMIELNVIAVTRLAKQFIGPMVERGEGEILNTASMAGLAPTPNQAVYSSTKAYVVSFSEALAHEFEGEGITVTALCPGPVDTEFMERDEMEGAGIADDPANDATSVAQAGYEGLKKGKRVVIPSMKMKSLAQIRRVLPRRTVVSLAGNAVAED